MNQTKALGEGSKGDTSECVRGLCKMYHSGALRLATSKQDKTVSEGKEGKFVEDLEHGEAPETIEVMLWAVRWREHQQQAAV